MRPKAPGPPLLILTPLFGRPERLPCRGKSHRTSEKNCAFVKLSYMLDVRRMQVLRAVVTSGSVTAAATNLGYTPSAVSQQVAALEKQAGVALLERVGRGVRPTAAGRLLTEYAAVISEQVAEAETALADLRPGRTGRLAIRSFATAGAALVPPALARLRREHPGVQVDLKLVDPADSLPEVEQGRADLAIVVRPRERLRDGIRLVHLVDDPFRAVLPRGHRFAAKRVLDLSDLADEPWVANEWPPGSCSRIVLDACAAAGFSPSFVVESEDYATAQGFVAAGLGISLIPRTGLGSRHPAVVVRKVRNPQPSRKIYAAVREASLAQPALRGLLDALRDGARP
jgi:DNA-binding transcriptional LysR family regulator